MSQGSRVIVITGGSGGLAQALVKSLPNDRLILLGRDLDKMVTLYQNAPQVCPYALDITDKTAVVAMVDSIYQTYGHIDVLINNAGYGEFKAFNAFEDDEIQQMFEVNTLASIRMARLVAEKMLQSSSGHIVNVVSMAGLIASAKSSIYSATKFAMIGFSNALRLEVWDKGIFVTAVNPGPIATPFFDQADPSGEYLKKVEPFLLSADSVAQKIVRHLGKNKRDLNLPFTLALAAKAYALFPTLSDWVTRKMFNYK